MLARRLQFECRGELYWQAICFAETDSVLRTHSLSFTGRAMAGSGSCNYRARPTKNPSRSWGSAFQEKLARLVDDLLDLTRIERDHIELRREP
jgi:hypothetical protein